MHGRSAVVVVLLLLPLHGFLCLGQPAMDDDDDIEEGSSFHLHVSPPVVPDSVEKRREHYRAMEAKDLLRHRVMVMKQHGGGSRRELIMSSNSNVSSTMFELPMRSALNIVHVGMYLVSVRIGTPAQPFSMALDTASDLTWLNCRLRRRKGKHYGLPPVERQSKTVETLSVDTEGAPVKVVKNWYRPALSSSWRRYRCSQQRECGEMLFLYHTCQTENKTESCTYDHRMFDGTRSIGIFGQDKATVALSSGRMSKLPGVMLGCSTVESGGSVDAHDGVLTLGHDNIAFGTIAAKRFGNRFSFCLLSTTSDPNASSYLTFGPNPAVQGPGTMETRLVHPLQTRGYGPRVTGIVVGGELLDIPPEVWDHTKLGGGVVLDTGTSLTSLHPSAYAAVTTALNKHLAGLERVTDMEGFEFCYRWNFTGGDGARDDKVTIPKFVVELEGGARLEPDAKSFILPEVEPGVACLAFRQVGEGSGLITGVVGPGVIGNVLMQEHIWEFDILNEKLSFRKDKCLNHPQL